MILADFRMGKSFYFKTFYEKPGDEIGGNEFATDAND